MVEEIPVKKSSRIIPSFSSASLYGDIYKIDDCMSAILWDNGLWDILDNGLYDNFSPGTIKDAVRKWRRNK